VSAPETSIEPILGWRVWHVDPRPDRARLLSWTQSDDWPYGRRMEASCRPLGVRWPRRRHEAPCPGHRCGIYALRERAAAEALLRQLEQVGPGAGRFPSAVGRVSMWGRVIENSGGWRAQFAYPYDLVLYGGDEALATDLRGRYAVDVAPA
jgi:hypothetical protein